MEEKEDVENTFNVVEQVSDSEGKKAAALNAKQYILNNWDAITIRNHDEKAKTGCSAEGQVGHILSSRLSRNPLGWTVKV